MLDEHLWVYITVKNEKINAKKKNEEEEFKQRTKLRFDPILYF